MIWPISAVSQTLCPLLLGQPASLSRLTEIRSSVWRSKADNEPSLHEHSELSQLIDSVVFKMLHAASLFYFTTFSSLQIIWCFQLKPNTWVQTGSVRLSCLCICDDSDTLYSESNLPWGSIGFQFVFWWKKLVLLSLFMMNFSLWGFNISAKLLVSTEALTFLRTLRGVSGPAAGCNGYLAVKTHKKSHWKFLWVLSQLSFFSPHVYKRSSRVSCHLTPTPACSPGATAPPHFLHQPHCMTCSTRRICWCV